MDASDGNETRRYRPRSCDGCGAQFQPTGPRHRFCSKCGAKRRAKQGAELPDQPSMVNVNTQAPAHLAAAFTELARRRERTVAAELRRLIREALQNDEDPAATRGLATTPAEVTSGYGTH